MSDVESISSILSNSAPSTGETTTPPVVEQVAETQPVEAKPVEATTEPVVTDKARDEAGRFTKAPEKTEEVDGRTVALREERRKRQELQAELAKYQEQKPKTDFFENPEKAFSENVEPLQRELLNLKVELETVRNPEFKDLMMTVLEKAAEDPLLKHQIDTAPDPIKLIARLGKQFKELPDGDLEKYRERVTGELKGELSKRDQQIAALTAQVEALSKAQKELESIPRSLNKGNESAPRTIAETDDDSITSIVRFGNKR